MDRPSELEATCGEYLFIKGMQYYDLFVIKLVADTICRMHGFETGKQNTPGCKFIFYIYIGLCTKYNLGSYWPITESWKVKQWSPNSHHENLMWTHHDKQWFQARKQKLEEAGEKKANQGFS
jgi:hypothetical protein